MTLKVYSGKEYSRKFKCNMLSFFSIIQTYRVQSDKHVSRLSFFGYYIIYTVFVTVTVKTILNRVNMLNYIYFFKVTPNKITFNYAD